MITLQEQDISVFHKNYDQNEKPQRWMSTFDLTNWIMLVITDINHRPIAGAILAMKTAEVHLLRGRNNLAILWDIRINETERGKGIGRMIFEKIVGICRISQIEKLHIETQNNNYGACKFYQKMGCQLIRIDLDSYPEFPDEAQLLWQYIL